MATATKKTKRAVVEKGTVMLSVRIPVELRNRLGHYETDARITAQAATRAALDEYLKKRGA